MIKAIHIQNYQSHKDTNLEFSPGVNVIVGATDSGKSAIIKALRWVLTNRPTGDSFRSSWGGDTEVTVAMDDNMITRMKTDKLNLYQLNELEFKAFGADVPEEIRNVLNMDHINVQTQFDPHFLLSESAGAIATHFNKVAHLDKIDVSLQNIQRWLKKIQADIVYKESSQDEYLESLTEYDDLEDIEKLIVKAELLEKDVEWTRKKGMRLTDLTIHIEDVDEEIVQTEKITSKGILVEKVLSVIKEKEATETLVKRLEKGVRLITEVTESIEDLKHLQPFEKMVNRALAIDQIVLDIGYGELLKLVGRIQYTSDDILIKAEELRKMHKQLHDNMKICPLCETVLK